MTKDTSTTAPEDVSRITDANGRAYIRRTIEVRFAINQLQILDSVTREHDNASLKPQKSIVGFLSAAEKGLAVIGHDEQYYSDKPIRLLISSQECVGGLFEAIREAKGFTSEDSLYTKHAYEIRDPNDLSVVDIWFTDQDHRYHREAEWNCNIIVSHSMLDRICEMFKTGPESASITITLNAFITTASYSLPFPEARYWYIPAGELGSLKACGTINSITLVMPTSLRKTDGAARIELTTTDDEPEVAAEGIARPAPGLDPELTKTLRHIARYLLYITIALASIAVFILFRLSDGLFR